MARLAGVDLPPKKRAEIGLTYIYGIGRSRSRSLLHRAGIEFDKKVDFNEKIMFSVQSLIWVLGSYYLARTFDDSTKSLEELCARLRRRR